jgi:trimethylamine---corrinoid protein Co-methyltransferase
LSNLTLSVLSHAEIETIHEKSIKLIADTGFHTSHHETLVRFRQAGALVDETAGLIKIPGELTAELLSLAPDTALETGLNGKTLSAGGANRYYVSLILDPYVVDWDEGIRKPKLEDVRRNTIVGESLDRVNAMMRMQYPVSDIPGQDSYYKTMEVFLANTTKHIAVYPVSEANCREWMDAAAVVAESASLPVNETPLLSVAMAVTSPLQIHPPNIEIMKQAMERCYPIIPTVCPMAGTTSPYSVAGTFLQANLESLLPILVVQLYKPGHPVFYGIGPSATDMKTGRDLYYRAEKSLFKIMANQMAEFYHLPSSGEAGGTLTHRADLQNGAESMLYLLSSHGTRQNIIGGLGSLGNANGMSTEQIIMQCGLVDMAEYVSRGVDVSEEKLGVKSIEEVGPGGNFMMDSLTLSLLRDNEEFLESEYLDLSGGYDGEGTGMYEKAHIITSDLVSGYESTVPEKTREAIGRFFYDKYSNKTVADL